jgi:hypothetical protein
MLKKIDDVEAYYKSFLNEQYEKVVLFEKYQYGFGDVLFLIDYSLFRTACLEFMDGLVKGDVVYYIKGDYYELC